MKQNSRNVDFTYPYCLKTYNVYSNIMTDESRKYTADKFTIPHLVAHGHHMGLPPMNSEYTSSMMWIGAKVIGMMFLFRWLQSMTTYYYYSKTSIHTQKRTQIAWIRICVTSNYVCHMVRLWFYQSINSCSNTQK